MTEYQTLLTQKAELDAQIAAAEAERKAEGIAQAQALIQEHSLTAADLFPPAKSKGASAGAALPKYRDPATGATWTGRVSRLAGSKARTGSPSRSIPPDRGMSTAHGRCPDTSPPPSKA